MRISELIEVVCATHLASFVESPFSERGGLIIVGAPATLKSTAAFVLEKSYSDAVTLSDINAQGLIALRDAIAAGSIRTLVLPEIAKLYERHPQTASNVEGTIRALAGEGFAAASFEDQRINSIKARATVIGALTPAMQRKQFKGWEESGFNRRFLWSLLRLKDAHALEQAVIDWKLIEFNITDVPRMPLTGGQIPNLTTADDRRQIHRWCKYQPGGNHALQIQLLSKILAVLRWWYREKGDRRDAMTTVGAFAVSLGRDGAMLDFEAGPTRRTARRRVSTHVAGQTLAKRRWGKKK